MKKVTFYCDICGNTEGVNQKDIQVVFDTEQDEGRSCDPYLEIVKLDICKFCFNNVLKGAAIRAKGAQGNNHYSFFPSTLPTS